MVIIPVDGFLRVPGRDQRPDPGIGAGQVAGAEARTEERVGRLQEVVDVLDGRRDVIDIALIVVVGGSDQASPQPGQGEDRPSAGRGNDRPGDQRQVLVRDRDVGPSARPNPRYISLGVQLLGTDAIGPHAGRVHDVVRMNGEI